MAETNAGKRSGATGQYTWLWALAAVVVLGAFMVWLAIKSEPTTVTVQEVVAEEEEELPALQVDVAEFAMNPTQYGGQDIRLAGIPVASLLGKELFWVELSSPQGALPYLVKADSTKVAGGRPVASGDVVVVTGNVHALTDSVLTVWLAEGVLKGDAQLNEAAYATSYLDALRVRKLTGSAAQQ